MHSARLLACGLVLALLACGSKTGLLVPQSDSQGSSIGVPPDASADASFAFDASEQDVLPPIDVTPPRDVASSSCPDAGATLVYVITEQYDLMSFYPPTATFTRIGRIQCPARSRVNQDGTLSPATPFSMAVDRQGIAFVVYDTGELFRVSTATAACRPTPFVAGQQGFRSFGMGYSQDPQGPGETLYVASDGLDDLVAGPPRLGTIDTQAFLLRVVGPFLPSLYGAELTGTGAGDLFAFYSRIADGGSVMAIGQVDKTTGHSVAESALPGIERGCGWAFAFWGGDFYTFTAPGDCGAATRPGTVVHRFTAKGGGIVKVTQIGEEIVGAGVSTCAPQQ
jgi:hypothetical protein